MRSDPGVETSLTLPQRLWIYQRERFPLLKTSLLLAVFTAASISVSSRLGGRPLPGGWTFFAAWLATLIVFFQMRACDEVKDFDEDARFRPERPIPRGLVSLALIVGLGIALAPVAAFTAASLGIGVLLLLGLVWLWLGLMTVEFFAPRRLKARPFPYLVSHMAIMPLIDLFVTGAEWLPRAGYPPPGLGWFLGLSFVNGCVLEIGRKVWAPANERAGVETYSALLGPAQAAGLWLAALAAACGLLVGIGFAAGAPWAVGAIGLAALTTISVAAIGFARHPTRRGQDRIDALAGAWVLICYAAAGFVPQLAAGVLP